MTDLRAPGETTLRVQGLPTADTRWSVQCLNCETPLHGRFCSNCGQRAVPPHPTLRQLAGDAVDEFTGWDGKFVETLKTLFRKPGEVTRQWIEGRRVRFISPWRLYIAASLVYFAVTAAAPTLAGRPNVGPNVELTRIDPSASAAERVSESARLSLNSEIQLTPEERDSALADIARAPAFMQPMLRRAIDEPDAFQAAIRRAMPNVFLALVPVLAGILSIFYRGRNYPEHLYFAVHLAAFIFIARALGNLTLFTYNVPIAAAAQVLMLGWVAVYGVMAFRRVYGGSVAMTILKGVGIAALYALIAAPVIAAVAFIAAS